MQYTEYSVSASTGFKLSSRGIKKTCFLASLIIFCLFLQKQYEKVVHDCEKGNFLLH